MEQLNIKAPCLVVVQARYASTRFPGKVLQPLLGQPMLLWLLDRVSRMETPHHFVVACPATPGNAAIAELCAKHGYRCHLWDGPENDVLGRFHAVATLYPHAQDIVRLTADCPLIDPTIVDGLLTWHMQQRDGRAPVHTGIAAEWPDGMDCEVFTRQSLMHAHAEATVASDREHVSPYIWRNAVRFPCQTYPCPFDLRALQVSVDTPDDASQVETLLRFLLIYHGFTFGWRDVWHGITINPDLRAWQHHRAPRNSAYLVQKAQERGTGTPEARTWEEERYSTP